MEWAKQADTEKTTSWDYDVVIKHKNIDLKLSKMNRNTQIKTPPLMLRWRSYLTEVELQSSHVSLNHLNLLSERSQVILFWLSFFHNQLSFSAAFEEKNNERRELTLSKSYRNPWGGRKPCVTIWLRFIRTWQIQLVKKNQTGLHFCKKKIIIIIIHIWEDFSNQIWVAWSS